MLLTFGDSVGNIFLSFLLLKENYFNSYNCNDFDLLILFNSQQILIATLATMLLDDDDFAADDDYDVGDDEPIPPVAPFDDKNCVLRKSASWAVAKPCLESLSTVLMIILRK